MRAKAAEIVDFAITDHEEPEEGEISEGVIVEEDAESSDENTEGTTEA